MFIAPHSRFRLYSTLENYTQVPRLFCSRSDERDRNNTENALTSFLGAPALLLPMNRVGVFLVFRTLFESTPKREVVMSPYTIADIVNMVICAGGVPVFADIERRSCNMDPSDAVPLIGDKTAAVLVTHLHGSVANLDPLVSACRSWGVPLIEDCAQAFGAQYAGKLAGTVGDIGIFSFGTFKNICAWFGGAVTAKDPGLLGKIRDAVGAFPRESKVKLGRRMATGLCKDVVTYPPIFQSLVFWVFRYGILNDVEAINRFVRTELDVGAKTEIPERYLRQVTGFQANLIRKQLERIECDSTERRQKAQIYHEGLAGLPELIQPEWTADFRNIFLHFPVQYSPRDTIVKYMMRRRCDVFAQYYRNCADLPGFAKYYRDCPRAREVSTSLFFLPTYPGYPVKDVVRNVNVIREFFGASRA